MPDQRLESRAQIVYFSHGGGPLPILGDPGHKAMVDFMTRLPAQLRRPRLILVISAHWEEREATVMGAAHPEMFYDYYGFPEQAYEIKYPVPGSPELAAEVLGLFESAGLPARLDTARGFDHGLFIPLKLMYPQADIPATQLSLLRGLDAAGHIALGRALRGLAHENILVIGSGFSFHNMSAFGWQGSNAPDAKNDAFQDWLVDIAAGAHSQEDRERALVQWQQAPSARYCHPREEHLMPLHVCAGMADGPATVIFDDMILGKRSLGLLW